MAIHFSWRNNHQSTQNKELKPRRLKSGITEIKYIPHARIANTGIMSITFTRHVDEGALYDSVDNLLTDIDDLLKNPNFLQGDGGYFDVMPTHNDTVNITLQQPIGKQKLLELTNGLCEKAWLNKEV